MRPGTTLLWGLEQPCCGAWYNVVVGPGTTLLWGLVQPCCGAWYTVVVGPGTTLLWGLVQRCCEAWYNVVVGPGTTLLWGLVNVVVRLGTTLGLPRSSFDLSQILEMTLVLTLVLAK